MPPRGVRPKVAEVRDVDIVASCVRILKRFTHPLSIYPPAFYPARIKRHCRHGQRRTALSCRSLFGKSDFALA